MVVTFLLRVIYDFSGSVKSFAILFLLVSAGVNILLAAGLILHKPKVYPAAIGIISLFVAYQLFRLVEHFSLWLFALTLFDLLVIWLIRGEYKRITARLER